MADIDDMFSEVILLACIPTDSVPDDLNFYYH